MNMIKIRVMAAAVAMACAGSAHALDVSLFNEADTTNQVTIRVAGSSAHDNGLERLMTLTAAGGAEICQAGTLDLYRTADKNGRLFFCRAGTNAGAGLAGKRLAVFKRSNGGSGVGVGTILRAGTVTLSDGSTVAPAFLNTATIGSVAGVAQPANGNFAAYTLHDGVPNSATVTAPANSSDVGISDEEPNKFFGVFAPAITATEADAIATTTKGISGVIFGVPVTQGIYERLQAVEFPTTSNCNPNNAGYTAAVAAQNGAPATTQGLTDACMPSLTKAQLQALYTQNYGDWSLIQSSHTAGLDVTTATTPNYPTALATSGNTGVYISRRAITSGTQAGFEMAFTGERCLTGTQLFATTATGGTDASNVPFVNQASSGGGVIADLNAKDAAGLGAIGILTTESVPGASDKFRFIKINGYAPTVLNTVESKYDMWFESTLQYRAKAVNGLPALGGDQKKVADAIATNLGLPNVVNDLDRAFAHTFGIAGLLANAVSQAANAPVPPFVTVAYNSNNASDVLFRPVALKTRGANGTVNACLPPVDVSPSQGNP